MGFRGTSIAQVVACYHLSILILFSFSSVSLDFTLLDLIINNSPFHLLLLYLYERKVSYSEWRYSLKIQPIGAPASALTEVCFVRTFVLLFCLFLL